MKRTIALVLALLMLTGCADNTANSDYPTEEITEEQTAIVTAEAKDTEEPADENAAAAQTAEAEPEQEIVRDTLGDFTYNELRMFNTKFYEINRNLISEELLRYNYFLVHNTDSMISVKYDGFYIRNSTRALKSSAEELNDIVSSSRYTQLSLYSNETLQNITFDPIRIYFEEDLSEGLKAKSLRLGYYINSTESISFNAFVRKRGDNRCSFIIDPAYLFALPLFTSRTDCMEFDINGTVIYGDTLAFDASSYKDYDFSEDYVYAKVTVSGVNVEYDTEQGYMNSCTIDEYEVISEDTTSVLLDSYLFSGEDKDPEMSEVYNAIIDSIDTIMTENTNGLTLLDLDFDATPELLVSNSVTPVTEDGSAPMDDENDVAVYRIENGSLKYIDTIYSTQRVVYETANNLGLITLEDGTQAWFGTSYKNRDTGELSQTDYLYNLMGDKLAVTEVFSKHRNAEYNDDDTWYFSRDTDYYYFGEKMLFEEVVNEDYDPEEAYSTPYFLVWGDESSIFGAWEIYGFARAAFCEQIEKSFRLYSPWLSGNSGSQRFELTERELSYNIAFMVDSFYLGEYNAAEYSYYYWFLGDYAKPVIYLYPEEQTDVSVQVDFTSGGAITCSYPDYNGGWNVTALPDGTIYDENGDEYYCLYWEGVGAASYDTSKGWCVAGKDTAAFLREKLMYIGLSAREANEFIIYWLPLMQDNPYNVISLHTEQYAAEIPLTVSPAPDTQIRVFMTYTPSEEFIEIQPQTLPSYERNGFVLVEWGGSEG